MNKLRVLIVDDSPTVLYSMKSTLESKGCIVETNEDIWILDIVKTFKPDILIMDVNLGACASGPVALSAMNRRKQLKDICQVIYSSEDEKELQDHVEACGAFAYIKKGESESVCDHLRTIYYAYLEQLNEHSIS